MKPISFEETFKTIHQVKEVNNTLLDTLIRRMKEFVIGVDQLNQSLSKTPSELPTKRQKKFILSFKSMLGPSDFGEIEPNLTNFWNNITSNFLNQNPGLGPINDSIKSIFVDRLMSFKEDYNNQMTLLETTYNQHRSVFLAAEANYKKADGKYRELCQTIEDLKQRSIIEAQSGRPEEQISKTRSQLSDAKNELQTALEEAMSATKAYNESLSKFFLEEEKCLVLFESIDKDRSYKFSQIIMAFSEVPKAAEQSKKSACQGMLDQIQPLLSFDENIKSEPSVDNQEALSVKFVPKIVDFNIEEFLDPKKLFAAELKQGRYTLKNDFSSSGSTTSFDFPKGTVVTAVASKITKTRVINEANGECATIPNSMLQRETRYDRKVAKLKVDVNINTNSNDNNDNDNDDENNNVGDNNEDDNCRELKGTAGQIVLVNFVNNGVAQCIDMYNRKGNIPIENLVF